MNLTAVLLTGLLAGGVSCAAVQGGLLAGLITRQRAAARTSTPATMPASAPARHTTPPGATTGTTTRTTWSVLGDDLTPVGAFLTGKLLSHTLIGALLGALGTAVQPSVRVNTALQIIAG
nr:hypothetical protein [Actinomycetota bacterium]